MRIISGLARGTKLYTLEGTETRPTLDRVKEPLFSIIQNNIPNANVLDLFAGSGALGLESLSRGAKKAILCDKSYKAIAIIKQNVEKTRLIEKAEVIQGDYKKVLNNLTDGEQKFDIIFLDPPYKQNIMPEIINKIIELNLLAEDGIVVAETDQEQVVEEIKNTNMNINDIRKYGRVILIFLNRKG